MSSAFSKAAHWIAEQCGHAGVFIIAVFTIVIWAATGPLFGYSDTWQLIINTGTTIITFLMVFLIQNTQNRDTAAIQLKLDELIRANEKARNRMLCLEDLTEDELKTVKATFAALADPARQAIEPLHDAQEHLEEAEGALQQVTVNAAGRSSHPSALKTVQPLRNGISRSCSSPVASVSVRVMELTMTISSPLSPFRTWLPSSSAWVKVSRKGQA
jgi:low affinity Fe/Cu permease